MYLEYLRGVVRGEEREEREEREAREAREEREEKCAVYSTHPESRRHYERFT